MTAEATSPSADSLDPEVVRRLVEGIARIAAQSRSEEDLRIGTERLLGPALTELGIEVTPYYERSYSGTGSVLSGRSDAVYGRVVIEYEPVGALRRDSGIRHAAEQLDRYLRAESEPDRFRARDSLKRTVGVGLDGERIFFLRYRQGGRGPAALLPVPRQQALPLFEEPADSDAVVPTIIGPYSVNAESVRTFLLYLRALRRYPLAPETLANVFGHTGEHARSLVAALYQALRGSTHPKVQAFFREWDRIFGIVYGQDLTKAERDTERLERAYGQDPGLKLKPLLFAVHTYSALLMKLLAMELASLQRGSIMPSPTRQLPSFDASELKVKLVDLESGGLFVRLGIHNFLEGDFFGWYLETWNDQIAEGVRGIARSLGEFEPATGSLEPAITRDLLKRLYQYLVPKELRHDLGEYYTPDWLAELILDEVGYQGQLEQRILDPACGSGTFLVLAIQRARAYADENLLDPGLTVSQILRNIVGFDLNPLAVIAARTNYLLALGNLVSYQSNLEIPIYLCDSVLTPVTHEVAQLTLGQDYSVPSSAGTFRVPAAIVESQTLGKLTSILEECVAADYTPQEFVERAKRELPLEDPSTIDELYRTLHNLKRERKNGVWARIIENAFAPIFAGRFEYVVGNPPWIGWESLSDDYRDATVALWRDYGLFSLKGHSGT